MAGRRRVLFLTTCSDDSKPYMILVALIKGFQNHIGFAIIQASETARGRYTCGSDTMRVQTGCRLSFETCPK